MRRTRDRRQRPPVGRRRGRHPLPQPRHRPLLVEDRPGRVGIAACRGRGRRGTLGRRGRWPAAAPGRPRPAVARSPPSRRRSTSDEPGGRRCGDVARRAARQRRPPRRRRGIVARWMCPPARTWPMWPPSGTAVPGWPAATGVCCRRTTAASAGRLTRPPATTSRVSPSATISTAGPAAARPKARTARSSCVRRTAVVSWQETDVPIWGRLLDIQFHRRQPRLGRRRGLGAGRRYPRRRRPRHRRRRAHLACAGEE